MSTQSRYFSKRELKGGTYDPNMHERDGEPKSKPFGSLESYRVIDVEVSSLK
jgi:hypothetical protein